MNQGYDAKVPFVTSMDGQAEHRARQSSGRQTKVRKSWGDRMVIALVLLPVVGFFVAIAAMALRG